MNAHLATFKKQFAHIGVIEYLDHCRQITAAVRAIEHPGAREEALTALLQVIRWFHRRDMNPDDVAKQLHIIEERLQP